jgi:hypothetical protein
MKASADTRLMSRAELVPELFGIESETGVVPRTGIVLDFERLIQNVDSLLQAFREVFQLQMTKDDPLSIAMK